LIPSSIGTRDKRGAGPSCSSIRRPEIKLKPGLTTGGYQAETERNVKRFDFKQLKKVANDLNWDAIPRKLRDNSKEIYLHIDKLPDKNLKYSIFKFATHMAKYSRL
jgi:hypothetical protein